jgi:hypothetical protein
MATDEGLVRWGRAALMALLVWWTLDIVSGHSTWHFVDWANLPFHEAGHVFLRPFGRTAHFLGGTLFQLLIPVVLGAYLALKRESPFGSACCAWWLGENLTNVAVYMADARELQLDLVGGGEHDWNEIFYRFGLLAEESVATVSATTRSLGVLVMLLGLAWAALFLLSAETRRRLTEPLTERLPWTHLLVG